jgi:hypothetical protein
LRKHKEKVRDHKHVQAGRRLADGAVADSAVSPSTETSRS